MINMFVDGLDRVFRLFLTVLMAAMVLCVTWQIVSRYFLGDPSPWTEELARFLLVWIGLLGGSYAYHVKMHLGLDLLGPRLTGIKKAVHQIFIHAVVIVFAVAVLIVGGMSIVQLTADLKQYSTALGVPMSVVYYCLPVSGVMLVVYALVGLLKSVSELRLSISSSAEGLS